MPTYVRHGTPPDMDMCLGGLRGRTLSYDLPERVVADNPNLLRRQLLSQLVVRVRELGLVVLRLGDGGGVPVAGLAVGCSWTGGHDDMYRE